ncbi:MAG: hypothetical protein ABEI58_00320 [Candidatus Nanohaloarchaea archaeon]
MTDEVLKDWVKERLDDGVEPERLKEIMEETGKDASVVDEVLSPFGDRDEDLEFDEEDFIASGEAGEESGGDGSLFSRLKELF